MRVSGVTTLVCDAHRTNWVFVRVDTDSGIHGWGEATLECREKAVVRAVEELEDDVVGRDPHDVVPWWQDAYRDAYWRGGPVLTTALGAIEMALWDIKGKDLGVPVATLLGGRIRAAIPCYANAWFASAGSPDDFARMAGATARQGYRALKWDPFGSAFRSASASTVAASMDAVARVRAAVGSEVDLLIEGHGRFDLPSAARIGRALEQFEVLWFEEPLIPGNIDALARLKRETTTPLSVGERLYTRWDFREVIEKRAADYLQPDVSHVGGIMELLSVAHLAETWHLGICPHNPSGPVANAATLQLAASVPNFEYLETMATDVPWRSDVAREECEFADGSMVIPASPGLGVELNEDEIRKHPYVRHPLRHYTGRLTHIRPSDATSTFLPGDGS